MLFASEERISSIQSDALRSAELELTATTKTAAAARDRAAILEKEAAGLSLKAAELENQIEAERRTHLPRSMTGEQREALVARLSRARKGSVGVLWKEGDEEARMYAIFICGVLIDSKFIRTEDLTKVCVAARLSYLYNGAHIFLRLDEKYFDIPSSPKSGEKMVMKYVPAHLEGIVTAFGEIMDIKLDPSLWLVGVAATADVMIVVGAKP